MIDINLLAQPLLSLLSSFGSGVIPSGGASDALTSASSALESLHTLGKGSINQLNTALDGVTADAATAKALRVQTSSAQTSDVLTEMAAVVNQAAAQVETGQKELDTVVQSFVSNATSLLPTITTPVGLTALVSTAIDHLNQGIGVVNKTQTELQTSTASMNELTPAPSTAPAATSSNLLSTAKSALDSLTSGTGGLASSALNTGVSAISSAAKATTSKTKDTTQTPSSNTSTAKQTEVKTEKTENGGVKITLPDGSVVEAPNEKAAKAVTSALSAVGTPYVWGGNDPNSGIDCSGLTKWAYSEAGVELPRLAQEQHIGHQQVSPGDLQPGDLAVWDGHVAMVIGNGQLVEAGDPVSVSSIRTENIGMEFYGFYRPTS
ncbi:NlpC/P60 family protein [Nocardia sp. NPDC048505]|uniref:C40 family peptidase n=1 Tax=unclassified Nocardia TaxID=2637762 RepID=UPI0033E4145C